MMPKHRGGILTPYEPVIPLRPPGYGGTGPSPALALPRRSAWLRLRSAALDLAQWRL